MLEWLKRHAWKACSRLKRLTGSNPVLSAKEIQRKKSSPLELFSLYLFCPAPPQAERDAGAQRRNPGKNGMFCEPRPAAGGAGCRSTATESQKERDILRAPPRRRRSGMCELCEQIPERTGLL